MLHPGVISAESDELIMNVTFSFQFLLSYTTVAKKENVIRLMKKKSSFFTPKIIPSPCTLIQNHLLKSLFIVNKTILL